MVETPPGLDLVLGCSLSALKTGRELGERRAS